MSYNTTHIRNISIVSHIDHGKSTLADRFLELTNTIPKQKMKPQYLDSMSLEREKGITIKMHPVRMFYNGIYILNLIDTPGHADFSYEISRALACVEGVILLVDATRGIQAQTLFNLEQAQKQNLEIIGAVNKIDLPVAEIEQTREELSSILNQKKEEIFLISAKTGENTSKLLEALVKKFPSPNIEKNNSLLKALIFDSEYDPFSGVITYIRVFAGEVKKGDRIYLMAQKIQGEVREVGIFSPTLRPSHSLKAGDIGYIKTGIKESSKVRVGDTIVKSNEIQSLPGYKEPQPVLFLGLYPENADHFENLKQSLEKLRLTDPSLNLQLESKTTFGRGFRVGFLGSLQAEITLRRLKEEFGQEVISTIPQVVFKILTKDNQEIEISSPDKWPDSSKIKEIQEPWAKVEVITPNSYFNQVFKILRNYKINLIETKSLNPRKSLLIGETPLRKIIGGDFYQDLKSKTQGYASFNYQNSGFREADLIKLDILIAGQKEEIFSRIIPREKSFQEGKDFLKKLKEILPAQQFSVPLQAAIGGKIIARETIKAQRKDVTASLYGGDVTRKRKLLEIQKKGKKKLKERAKIKIPSQVFLEMLKS